MYRIPVGTLKDPRLAEFVRCVPHETRLALAFGDISGRRCFRVPYDGIVGYAASPNGVISPVGLHGPMDLKEGFYLPTNLGLTSSTSFQIHVGVTIPDTSQSGVFVSIGGASSGSYGVGLGIGTDNGDTPGNEIGLLDEGIAWYDNNQTIGTGFHVLTGLWRNEFGGATTVHHSWVDGVYGGSSYNSETIFQSPSSDLWIGGGNRALTNCIIHWVAVVIPQIQDQDHYAPESIEIASALYPAGKYVPLSKRSRTVFFAASGAAFKAQWARNSNVMIGATP